MRHSHEGDPDDGLFAFSRHLLAHAGEHRNIFPAMMSKRGGAFIQHLLRNLLVKVVRDDVKAMMPKVGQAPEEAVVQFISRGLFGLMMWWRGSRKHLSVEEVDDLFQQLAIPALKAAVPS